MQFDADEDGWLTTDGDFPTVRAQWHEGTAGAPGYLDIDVVLSEERCIEESFAGPFALHGADITELGDAGTGAGSDRVRAAARGFDSRTALAAVGVSPNNRWEVRCEVLLDNEPWAAGSNALASLTWPQGGDYSAHGFVMMGVRDY